MSASRFAILPIFVQCDKVTLFKDYGNKATPGNNLVIFAVYAYHSYHDLLPFFETSEYGVLAYAGIIRSSITKWGNFMPQEWFDLESQNFTQTFIPVGSTIALDMTSLATSDWQLSKLKHGWKFRFRRLWLEFPKNGLS